MDVTHGEVVENQRFFGVMWGASLPLVHWTDWPPWSDAKGQPVQLARPPTMDGQGGWFVVRTASTDEDGWLYGTKFERLTHARPGGRASRRISDTIRSRVWRRLDTEQELQPIHVVSQASSLRNSQDWSDMPGGLPRQHAHVSGNQILSALTSNFVYKKLPKPSVFRMWQQLMELWNDTASRNKLNKVIPMDPYGLYLATKSHRAAAAAIRRSTLQNAQAMIVGACSEPSPPSSTTEVPPPGMQSNRSFRSWKAVAPAASDIIAQGPLAGFGQPTTGGAGGSGAAAGVSTMIGQGQTSGQRNVLVVPASKPSGASGSAPLGQGMHIVDHLAAMQQAQQQAGPHGRYARRPATASSTASAMPPPPSPRLRHARTASHSLSPARLREHDGKLTTRLSRGSEGSMSSAASSSRGAVGSPWRWPWQTPVPHPPRPQLHSLSPPGPPPLGGPPSSTSTRYTATGLPDPAEPLDPAPEGSRPSTILPSDEPLAPPSLLPDMSNPTALVDELITIVNYARAAYGYVMAAGHMANIGTFINLVGMSAWFNPVTGASIEANNEAIHTLTGIPQSDILMAEWRNHIFRPCHFLALDREHGRLVLSIRGSMELGDICTDLAAMPTAFNFGGGLGSCHVHQGLIAAAEYIETSTRGALKKAAKQFPGWPLLITGHSLGAGVASLLTIMMRFGHGDTPIATAWADHTYCVAVACPPVVSMHVAERCTDFMVSLVHNMDFVPRLSHYSVELAIMEIARSSPLLNIADNLSSVMNKMKRAFPWGDVDGTGPQQALGEDGVDGDGDEGLPRTHSLDPDLAREVLATPIRPSEVQIELARQDTAGQPAGRHRRPGPAPQPSTSAPAASATSAQSAAAAPQPDGPDAFMDASMRPPCGPEQPPERTLSLNALDARWFGQGDGMEAPMPTWHGSFFEGWLPSYHGSEDGDHLMQALEAGGFSPRPASGTSRHPSITRATGGDGRTRSAIISAPQLQVPAPEPMGVSETTSSSDKLFNCWSDLVDVVKADAQAVVEAVSTTFDASLNGTLGAVAAAGRQQPQQALTAPAAAPSPTLQAPEQAVTTQVTDSADWVVVSPSAAQAGQSLVGEFGGSGTAGQSATVSGGAAHDGAVQAHARQHSLAAHSTAAHGHHTGTGHTGHSGSGFGSAVHTSPAGHTGTTSHTGRVSLSGRHSSGGAPSPSRRSFSGTGPLEPLPPPPEPTAPPTPTTLPGVIGQVTDDLQAARADKQARLGTEGGPETSALSKADVEKRLAPTKLYLPGRVLWVLLEEHSVVWEALQKQQRASAPSPGAPGGGISMGPIPKEEPAGPATVQATAPVGLAAPEPAAGKQDTAMEADRDAATAGGSSGGGAHSLDSSWRRMEMSIAQDFMPGLSQDVQRSAWTLPGASGLRRGAMSPPRGVEAIATTPGTRPIASHPVQSPSMHSPVRSHPVQGWDSAAGRKHSDAGPQSPGHVGSAPASGAPQWPSEASIDSDDGGLTNRLSLGFRQLKDNIEQVLGKAMALDDDHMPASGSGGPEASPGWGGSALGGDATWAAWGMGGSEETQQQGQMVCLLEVDRTAFEELSLVSTCASDHIPDAYYDALKQLQTAIMTGRAYGPTVAPGGGAERQGDQSRQDIPSPSARASQVQETPAADTAQQQHIGNGGSSGTAVTEPPTLARHSAGEGGRAPGKARSSLLDLWRLS